VVKGVEKKFKEAAMPDGVWKYDWGQNRARGTMLMLLVLVLLRMVTFMYSGNLSSETWRCCDTQWERHWDEKFSAHAPPHSLSHSTKRM